MRLINISAGRIAKVDDEDFELVSQYTWHWVKPRFQSGAGYAATVILRSGMNWRERGAKQRVFMHNLIAKPPEGLEVDHVNNDGLDNQKGNFRLASRQAQSYNRVIRSDSRTGWKGVHRDAKGRSVRWRASICIDGRKRHLGTFSTAEQAARAYDEAAQVLFGKFARLNTYED